MSSEEDRKSVSSDWSELTDDANSDTETKIADTVKTEENKENVETVEEKKENIETVEVKEEKVEVETKIEKIETKEENDQDVNKLHAKLAAMQNQMILLTDRFIKLACEKEQMAIQLSNRNSHIEDLQNQLSQLSLENPIIFGDPRISTAYMKRGNIATAIENALKRVQNRTYHRFYVGATSNPDERMRCHSKKGYNKMDVLFCTRQFNDAQMFETTLLDQVFHQPGCANMKNGSFGLVSSKQMFYVYILE